MVIIYASADIFAHPSVQLTRCGLIMIGLLSGGDYHLASLPRCGPGIAHVAKTDLGDEFLEAAQSLTHAELSLHGVRPCATSCLLTPAGISDPRSLP